MEEEIIWSQDIASWKIIVEDFNNEEAEGQPPVILKRMGTTGRGKFCIETEHTMDEEQGERFERWFNQLMGESLEAIKEK